MKKEETPILEPIPSFSSCLDQARNILFPNIFLKKKEEISGLEENFHLCLHPPFSVCLLLFWTQVGSIIIWQEVVHKLLEKKQCKK